MSSHGGDYPPEQGVNDEGPRVEPGPPTAKAERSRWPGWIWGIPVAAVLVVGWLALKQLSSSGPLVTVVFPGAQGISGGQTEVMYQGLKVGEVQSVKLQPDLRQVKAEIRLSAEMEGHIGKGTLFWISGPRLSDLSSIRSIISGPSIGIQPEPGQKQDEYQGLAEPPVVPETEPGTHYVLQASQLGSVSRGSQIYFHDLGVGKVDTTTLKPDRTFDINIFIKKPYDALVHDNTRFWNAGAVQISLQGAGPRVQLQSLPALLGGAIDFETPPRVPEGPLAPDGHVFPLYEDLNAAQYAPGPPAVAYRVVFGPDAGSLSKGAAVTLAGTQVGMVEDARLEYDPKDGSMREAVRIDIQPSRIALSGGAKWPDNGRKEMDEVMNRLIAQGLRAQPGSSVPFVGPKDVALAFVKAAAPASLIAGDPPEIPSQSGGSGLDGILASFSGVATKLDNLPLDQIAANIHTITERAAELSKSPELARSLESLRQSLANVERVTAEAKTDVPALIGSLRKVASEADRTVAAARDLVSTTAGNGPLGVNAAGLSQTLYQVSRAAESIRELTDYLTRHPSALIRGRQ